MTSIQTHMVGESGPYAYRVHGDEHPKAGPNGQYWDYLGSVGKVDPEDLTEDETAELREEGFALARFRDGAAGELHMRDIANSFRDEAIERWGEDVLAPTDDRRKTEVVLSESAPRAAETLLGDEAAEAAGEAAQAYGQAGLTEGERNQIDWSKSGQNVPHARTAKAALKANGVSDWVQVYSGDIESDGWEEIADRNRDSMQGDREDSGEVRDQQSGADAMKARSEMEEHALEGAAQGFDEARDALREGHGWTEAQIDATIEEREDL